MILVHVAQVRSINSAVAKMRKALFYMGFTKIRQIQKC